MKNRKLLWVFLSIILFISGCSKSDKSKESNSSTIDINKTNNSDIDKKIIIIWWEKPSYEDWDYDTFLYNWERYSWSEVIANTIINNPINKKVEY